MQTQPKIRSVTFEHYRSTLGVGHAEPRLSWQYDADENTAQNFSQSAYDVEVVRKLSGGAPESFQFVSGDSVLVPWPSKPLQSRERAELRVRAYGSGSDKTPTDWSPWISIEAGLLQLSDWKAKPMTMARHEDPSGPIQPIRFRKTFHLDVLAGRAPKARLYTTAWGVYQVYINGTRIGDQILAPGWTSYKHRLLYQVYDVPADLLNTSGPNVIAVEVGEGWYAGRLGFNGGERYLYGNQIASLIQLEVGAEGGASSTLLVSDDSWHCAKSAIQSSEIYDGEVVDMSQEHNGWNQDPTASVCEDWTRTTEIPLPLTGLLAQEAPPVTVTQELEPKEIFRSPSGKLIVDFGQNLVGKVRIRAVKLDRGQRLTLTHAEVLENGELGIRPLREAKCSDSIVSSGDEILNWTPKFTFHGFRYVQVDGWAVAGTSTKYLRPAKSDLTALVMHTDMRRTGLFSCSDQLVNKLHENVVWGMRGNFLSIPTDCPQRDERLGWTGDIQVFCPSASFLYDTSAMLGNWLQDLSVEQLKDEARCTPGIVVPNVLRSSWEPPGQAVWQDCAVLTPRDLYQSFGDVEILERQFASMKGWVDHGITRGPDGLWDPEVWQLGDWLDPAAPPSEPSKGRTDGVLVADAYLIRVISTIAAISRILHSDADASRYEKQGAELKAIFQKKYITPLGHLVGDTQTAISLAVVFSLFSDESQLKEAAIRLSRLVRASRFRISTGFAGTPLITHALTKTGQPQLAYRMLLEEKCPSWLYPVTMGATTMWERWDSMLEDGSINPGSMTSFNHYALGSVVDWLHTTVGGISPMSPGWRAVKVQPIPGGRVTSADVSYDGPYGKIKCSWTLSGTTFNLSVVIPPNSTAVIIMPGDGEEEAKTVGSGHYSFSSTYQLGEWPAAMFDPFCAPEVEQQM